MLGIKWRHTPLPVYALFLLNFPFATHCSYSFESQFHFHIRRCEGSAGKQVNLNGKVRSNRHTGEQLVVCLLCMKLFTCIFNERNDGSVVR